jgi:hypothetical protein
MLNILIADDDGGDRKLMKRALERAGLPCLCVETVRQPDDSWLLRQIRPESGPVSVVSLGVELKLADIYEKVEFAKAQTEAEASAP